MSIHFLCSGIFLFCPDIYDINKINTEIEKTNESLENKADKTDLDSKADKSELESIEAQIGNPENLETEDKSSLVNAINEVKASASGGGGASLPVGVIMPTATTTAPAQWLICDGSAISRTTYANLFNAIGTTYGTGDGSTTFNLPNLKGKIPVGYDANDTDFNTVGKTGGEKTHTLTVNEIPSHSHTVNFTINDADYSANVYQLFGGEQTNANASYSKTSKATGGSQAHNNMIPYVTMNYIIYAGV